MGIVNPVTQRRKGKRMSLTTFEDMDGLTKKAKSKLDEFLNRIQKVNKKGPVRSKIIEDALDLRGVEVRAIVNFLRKRGYPIGSSSKGYWYAKNMEEISDTIKHLYQRKTAIQSVINGLENSVFFAEQGKLFSYE